MTNSYLSELRRIARSDLSGYALDFTEECEDNLDNLVSSQEDIHDYISQFADCQVDVYYNKLLEFVKENPSSLDEVIEEGLYDPSVGYHFWDHVSAAQHMVIEHEIQDKLHEIVRYLAITYLWRVAKKDYTENELLALDDYLDPYSMSRFDEIVEAVDNFIKDVDNFIEDVE